MLLGTGMGDVSRFGCDTSQRSLFALHSHLLTSRTVSGAEFCTHYCPKVGGMLMGTGMFNMTRFVGIHPEGHLTAQLCGGDATDLFVSMLRETIYAKLLADYVNHDLILEARSAHWQAASSCNRTTPGRVSCTLRFK